MTFSPVDSVTRDVIPASIPTAVVAGGSDWTGHSTRIERCHRPAASRLTVTVDGSAPSGSGRDHTIASGADSSASQSWPSRYRNPDVVNVADARDRFRDLNAGYLARLAQKLA